jgi:transcriptional regulator with XRE-family HTH domain
MTGDDLAAVIRSRRRQAGLTINDLAKRAGMHPTYLARIERGTNNPTVAKVIAIAAALGVKLSDLVLEAEQCP